MTGPAPAHPARRRRLVPLLFTTCCVAAGIATLVLLGGPPPVVPLVVAMLAGLAATTAVTRRWKTSVHTAVAAGTCVAFVVTYGAAAAVAAPAVALVGWPRVELGDHTPAQTVAGAVPGAAVSGALYTVLPR